MYKLFRYFAPVVLVFYFCGLFVASSWGEEGKVTPPQISFPNSVTAGKPFQMNVTFDKSIYIPGQYSFIVEFINDLEINKSINPITKENYQLLLIAPTQEGKSDVRFMLKEADNTVWMGSAEISVANKATNNYPNIGINWGGVFVYVITLPFQVVQWIFMANFAPYHGNSL